jgi:hypothetical protein
LRTFAWAIFENFFKSGDYGFWGLSKIKMGIREQGIWNKGTEYEVCIQGKERKREW